MSNYIHVLVFTMKGCTISAAPAYSPNAIMLAGQSRGKSDKLWMQGGWELRTGTISPLLIDSSMQTTPLRAASRKQGH